MAIFKISSILKNRLVLMPTLIYTYGVREQFEAIKKIDKGVIIGRIIDGEFFDCGFISKRNIKEIRDGKKIES